MIFPISTLGLTLVSLWPRVSQLRYPNLILNSLHRQPSFSDVSGIPGDSKKTQQNLEPRHFVRSKPSIVKPHKTNDTSTLFNCFKFQKNWLSIRTTVSQNVTPTLWKYYRRVFQHVIWPTSGKAIIEYGPYTGAQGQYYSTNSYEIFNTQ